MMFWALSINANFTKPKKEFKYKLEIVSEVSEKGKAVTFDCFCYDMSMSWIKNFQITNSLTERVNVEWDNARFSNSKVVFGDDTKLTMRNPKADEVIAPNGMSIKRDLSSLDRIDGSTFFSFLFPYNELKKKPGQKATLDILIPIRYADNTTEEFKLQITVWYEMIEPTE